MVSEPRKQSMAWMETDYSKHTVLSIEDKMAARAFAHARNYGRDVTIVTDVWFFPLAQLCKRPLPAGRRRHGPTQKTRAKKRPVPSADDFQQVPAERHRHVQSGYSLSLADLIIFI